ncbi:hypothetical protein SSPO_025850 [Streptomyces antimycoticus]|uniref:Uncharacterized protein n=1 Tax=Streptomyces antimycoticus TaxID=68175 RepID=A0A499V103_9ACTN|nr:hypothetical protein SSPO_025850 [Streptomyces antimycoticus]
MRLGAPAVGERVHQQQAAPGFTVRGRDRLKGGPPLAPCVDDLDAEDFRGAVEDETEPEVAARYAPVQRRVGTQFGGDRHGAIGDVG